MADDPGAPGPLDGFDPVQLGALLARLSHASQQKGPYVPPTQSAQPPLADLHARDTGYETVGPPDPPPEPPSAWSKAETIGASRQGERYAPPSFTEIMASEHPLQGIAEHVLGAARPPSVYASDPTGVETWARNPSTQQPPLIAGTTEEVGDALARPFIRAYHGSPHDFDRFDISKVGTGEGGQSYGHGLYFAENEKVARGYRDSLANPTVEIMGQQQPVPSWSSDLSPQPRLIRRLADKRAVLPDLSDAEIVGKVRDDLRFDHDHVPSWDPETRNHLQSQLEILDAAEARGVKTSPGGHMYEVNLHVDPEHLLDLDRHIAQQSPDVAAKVEPWATRRAIYDGMPLAGGGNLVIRNDQYFLQMGDKRYGLSAADVDRLIGRHGTGASVYQNLIGRVGSQPGASAALQDLGIPGIRYLDQGSRSAGEGTRNYVMFDDRLIDILRKYGLVPPLAAGLLGRSAPQPVPSHDQSQ